MLISPEMLVDTGPPPQAIIDQLWLWKILITGFIASFVLQLLTLDVAAATMSLLLICFGVIMLQDGMEKMSKYVLIYGVLCGINLLFDLLPLVSALEGRVTRTSRMRSPPTIDRIDGSETTTYTLTTKLTPFFDSRLGFSYNAQSMIMLLSPICMVLGVYLASTAQNEIQRSMRPSAEYDWDTIAAGLEESQPASQNHDAAPERSTFRSFSGTPHKLSD
eukprot:TRINITY_DN8041_c0_g1_i1.p1 TRINITY_DN8041_c0_g1~~TRINITY_DN8041_c0_g1_i1.p1  ORF type:complete len:219 (+),score=22.67 TRINITY_DN8041_c0_g1_i1:128-784(+)